MDDHPSWRVARLEVGDLHGWHEVAADKLLDIRQKLANYESMTWGEILKDREYNHAVAVHRIIAPARKRLAEVGLGMLDEVFRLRLTGRERIWGYRVGAVLYIIWWDPLHQICPSPLRHT